MALGQVVWAWWCLLFLLLQFSHICHPCPFMPPPASLLCATCHHTLCWPLWTTPLPDRLAPPMPWDAPTCLPAQPHRFPMPPLLPSHACPLPHSALCAMTLLLLPPITCNFLHWTIFGPLFPCVPLIHTLPCYSAGITVVDS